MRIIDMEVKARGLIDWYALIEVIKSYEAQIYNIEDIAQELIELFEDESAQMQIRHNATVLKDNAKNEFIKTIELIANIY